MLPSESVARGKPSAGSGRPPIEIGQAVGPGKARVQVTADLDLARTTTQEEKFDPDGQVVRSTQTTEEKAKENQADQNGQVSAANNIPGVATTPATIISVYDVLNTGKLVLDKAALATIEEVFA